MMDLCRRLGGGERVGRFGWWTGLGLRRRRRLLLLEGSGFEGGGRGSLGRLGCRWTSLVRSDCWRCFLSSCRDGWRGRVLSRSRGRGELGVSGELSAWRLYGHLLEGLSLRGLLLLRDADLRWVSSLYDLRLHHLCLVDLGRLNLILDGRLGVGSSRRSGWLSLGGHRLGLRGCGYAWSVLCRVLCCHLRGGCLCGDLIGFRRRLCLAWWEGRSRGRCRG